MQALASWSASSEVRGSRTYCIKLAPRNRCSIVTESRKGCAFRDPGYSGGMGRKRGRFPGNCGSGHVGICGGTRGRIAPFYAEDAVVHGCRVPWSVTECLAITNRAIRLRRDT